MSMANLEYERRHKIDYELLALFDDVSALSQLETSGLDATYFEFFYEEPRQPRMDDRWKKNMDDCCEKNMDVRWKENMDDRPTFAKEDQTENSDVFAIPKVYNCLYCLKRFYSRSASRRHQVCHAKEQLRCPCCRARSYSVSAVRRHFEYFHHCTRRRQILIEAQ